MNIMPASEFKFTRNVEYGSEEQNQAVKMVLQDVKEQGDQALRAYSEKFDGVKVDSFRVTQAEVEAAYSQVEEGFLTALRQAADNIRRFHTKQKRNSWMDVQEDGTLLGQAIRPLQRVGMYVPGGKAAYPSSVLMNVIPAQVAGVKEIVMATPPATQGKEGIDPYILVAAAELGVEEIYRVGGAQAIAALAFGTESIPAVDKICGPGNIFVALAKRNVYGVVDIDSIAGPTDIVVLADEQANPAFVAADLLSQAEHDEMASAICITPSEKLAAQIAQELKQQLADLPRKSIAEASLTRQGAILTVSDLEEAFAVVNNIAPEHLELMVEQPLEALGQIQHAGAIFLGPYSSEPVGDYFAGPNHILPTNGTARFSSPLSVDDFIKKSSVIYYSKEALLRHGEQIMTLARHEDFEGHARAIQIRMKQERTEKDNDPT